jgi:membrane-associated phospholipid phosphatase
MFELHPIIWLQSWASPALTAVMNGISLLGYTRAYVAIAIFLVFALRLRPAIALLVVVGLSGALTDIAKTAAATPRPDMASNGAVQALSLYGKELRHREADTPTEIEDSYGFPSGHVSATTAFAVGLAMLFRWKRRGWTLAVAWILAMAFSRMYLGRHFLGDVIGGVGVGLATILVGFAVLKLGHLARESRAHDPWPAHRVMTVAIVLAGAALLVGLPDAGDAGRLLGTAIGALVLVHHDVFELAVSRRARIILLFAAIFGFGAAWGAMSLLLQAADPSSASALRLAASALPNAAVLLVPAYLPRRIIDAPLLTQISRGSAARR